MKEKKNWRLLILCLILVYAVGFLGSLFTSPNTNTDWYNSIRPEITPPNYVFPIVWNILFFLIALSLYLSLIHSKNFNDRKKVWILFGINFVLNVFWSVIYFGVRSPFFAFFELILLWLSITSLIYITYKINKPISLLIIPYFLWVSFAGVLNYLSAF